MSVEFPELNALKAGNAEAWNSAFYHLWPIALRVAHHPEACLVPWEREEVASDAILELIEHFDAVASIDQAKALLTTITYRRAISFARRKFAAKRTRPKDYEAQTHDEMADNHHLSDIERVELTVLMKRALDVLEPQTRQLLLEKIQQQSTYEEISARHGVPLGTVCTKVARGLKRIRDELQATPLLLKELRQYLR